MPRRKLLFYTHGLTGGGAERVWALLASHFAQSGDEVLFVVDRPATENRGYLDPAVRLVALDAGHGRAVLKLAALLRREAPDVSLAALGVSNLKMTLAAMFAGQLRRTILSVHGYFHSEPKLLSRIGNLAMPALARLTAATVCVSEGLRDHVIARWHLPARKTLRIYNPVVLKTAGAPPDRDALAQRDPIVLAVGRLVSYKAYPLLIDAFSQVATPRARLLILGEGEERQRIEAKIAALNLDQRIALLGYHPEPWRFYTEARCFVLPSDSEAFGNVVVEALANGLPVVATRCHGPLEILDEAGLGTLVPVGDAAALARAIDAALADPGNPAPRIARAADFGVEAAAKAYGALIDRVSERISG